MAEGYTPTVEEVREALSEWMWSRRMFRADVSVSDGRELDRFLDRLVHLPADAFSPEVEARMWDFMIPANGNPQRALRLAVLELLSPKTSDPES